MTDMPLADLAWSLIVAAHGEVRGKVFFLSAGTWERLNRECPRKGLRLYSVPVCLTHKVPASQILLQKDTP